MLLLVLLLSIISCKTTEPNVIIPDPEVVYVDVPVEIPVEAIPFPFWDLKPMFDMDLLLPSSDTSSVVQNNVTLIGYQLHLESYLNLIQTFYEGGDWESVLVEYKLE